MKKNCRRKPGRVNASSWFNAIANSQPPSAEEITPILLAIRIAFDALKNGAGTAEDFDKVGAMVNVGMIRAESIGQELVEVFKEAGEAMLECERITRRHGRTGFTGPHLQAVNVAIEYYGDILAMSSRNQMASAAEEADRRIRRGEAQAA